MLRQWALMAFLFSLTQLHGATDGVHELPDKAGKYALSLPRNYDPKKKYELIVALKGSDQSAGDFLRIFRSFAGSRDCIIAAPESRDISRWNSDELPVVAATVADVVKSCNVDSERVTLCGFSAGGGAGFFYIAAQPGLFKAYAAFAQVVSDQLDDEALEKAKSTPIFYSVGKLDAKYLAPSKKSAERLKGLGFSVDYETPPNMGHNLSLEQLKRMFAWLDASVYGKLPGGGAKNPDNNEKSAPLDDDADTTIAPPRPPGAWLSLTDRLYINPERQQMLCLKATPKTAKGAQRHWSVYLADLTEAYPHARMLCKIPDALIHHTLFDDLPGALALTPDDGTLLLDCESWDGLPPNARPMTYSDTLHPQQVLVYRRRWLYALPVSGGPAGKLSRDGDMCSWTYDPATNRTTATLAEDGAVALVCVDIANQERKVMGARPFQGDPVSGITHSYFNDRGSFVRDGGSVEHNVTPLRDGSVIVSHFNELFRYSASGGPIRLGRYAELPQDCREICELAPTADGFGVIMGARIGKRGTPGYDENSVEVRLLKRADGTDASGWTKIGSAHGPPLGISNDPSRVNHWMSCAKDGASVWVVGEDDRIQPASHIDADGSVSSNQVVVERIDVTTGQTVQQWRVVDLWPIVDGAGPQ